MLVGGKWNLGDFSCRLQPVSLPRLFASSAPSWIWLCQTKWMLMFTAGVVYISGYFVKVRHTVRTYKITRTTLEFVSSAFIKHCLLLLNVAHAVRCQGCRHNRNQYVTLLACFTGTSSNLWSEGSSRHVWFYLSLLIALSFLGSKSPYQPLHLVWWKYVFIWQKPGNRFPE